MNNAELRQHALGIFQAGIAAANPYLAVKRHFETSPMSFSTYQKVHIIAFGKAACAMANAAQEIIPAALLGDALAVTNYENVCAVHNIEVIGASHPLPDEHGFEGASRILALAENAKKDDLVFVLISGGGSALIPYPVAGVTLEEKIITTNLLLSCGATIHEMNCVRKHLSQLKGGGLVKFLSPATCYTLILSDVLDDDLSVIASGTTVGDQSTFAQAIGVLKSKAVWELLPESVKLHLTQGEQGVIAETPKIDDPIFDRVTNHLIGSNIVSVNAMQEAAQSLKYQVVLYQHPLCGEARDIAAQWVHWMKNEMRQFVENPTVKRIAFLSGGETTVTLRGRGRGGRNQEMALAFAMSAEAQKMHGKWVFLSGGSDGIDGTSPAAGGIVDATTLIRIRTMQLSPDDLLDDNNSYGALKAAGDLLLTGATGTNVADLQILLFELDA
ncbi:MAG: hypothetical protein RLZZ66_1891 [Pseudomonadota bacterium]|jgi:hydroxypyruvate reductase